MLSKVIVHVRQNPIGQFPRDARNRNYSAKSLISLVSLVIYLFLSLCLSIRFVEKNLPGIFRDFDRGIRQKKGTIGLTGSSTGLAKIL